MQTQDELKTAIWKHNPKITFYMFEKEWLAMLFF